MIRMLLTVAICLTFLATLTLAIGKYWSAGFFAVSGMFLLIVLRARVGEN